MLKNNISISIILAIFYFLSGKLSLFLSVENSIVTISIFFAEGISLAAILIYGKKIWPGIFMGQLMLALNTDLSFLPSVLISGINSLEAILAFYVLKYFKFDISFSKIDKLYLLFFVIIFILQPFSAILGNLTLLTFSIIDTSAYATSTFSWWFGNTMGQLLITPMLLLIYYHRKSINLIFTAIVLVVAAYISYFFIIQYPLSNLVLLLSITIPLSILASTYFGLLYASLVILSVSIISIISLHYSGGIFTSGTKVDNIININFYILVHILVVYINGILLMERNNALNDLSVLNTFLEKRIEEEIKKNREQQLMMMQQSRYAQMGEMISMIAHQWRQPLNSISLIIESASLKHKLGKLDHNMMLKISEDSKKQIMQMSQTIDDFRYFFRPDKQAEIFSVNASIHHVLMLLDPIFKENNIVVNNDLEDDVSIIGFSNELGQVLINILNNAKDALLENNSDKEKLIMVELKKEDTKIVISIEDNAGGVADNIMEQIFNPYFSTKEKKNGTGLGLYMSKSIIEEHSNGILSVKNSSNGAVFKIVLGG